MNREKDRAVWIDLRNETFCMSSFMFPWSKGVFNLFFDEGHLEFMGSI